MVAPLTEHQVMVALVAQEFKRVAQEFQAEAVVQRILAALVV
jgi:hypothetical protein